MQKHYLISSLIKQSNATPQNINNKPEPEKKYIKTMIQFVNLF